MNEAVGLESFGEYSFPFKYSQRYSWKLLGYFNHEKDIRNFVKQNNLQVGDRISRKIENDQLACEVLPVVAFILLGREFECSKQLQERIRAGKNLRKRFYRILEEHRENVDWQLDEHASFRQNDDSRPVGQYAAVSRALVLEMFRHHPSGVVFFLKLLG